MMKAIILSAFLAMTALTVSAQSGKTAEDNISKYIKRTTPPKDKVPSVAEVLAVADSIQAEQAESVDSMSIWFPYISMCDWVPGMRFMVIPDKKDLIIKTFTDASTGMMVSTASLRYKVMKYTGHSNEQGSLHEHLNFTCEETGAKYYFEVPTSTFDDYCYTRAGVPALVYLGDVDVAQEKLIGKTLITTGNEYYVDTPMSGDGYSVLFDIPVGTETKVVAVGAGTRSFPVKIIVKEVTENPDEGREFFQNVAISRTNSGMRDEEFDISNMIIHTFNGSFELADESTTVGPLFQRYAHKDVYTLIATELVDATTKSKVRVSRLTPLYVKSVRSQRGSEYAKVTLQDVKTKKIYTKDVLFVNKNKIGITDKQRDEYVANLFAIGNPKSMTDVREANWNDMQNGVVRNGFTENEVRLALGEPSRLGQTGNSYTWVYRHPGMPRATVYFNRKTQKVVRVDR